MINFEYKIKNITIEAYTLDSHSYHFSDERIPLFGFDISHLKGYHPMVTLKKGRYFNYFNIQLYLFKKWNIIFNFGNVSTECSYELALKEFKKVQNENG